MTMPNYEYQCRDCKTVFTVHFTLAEHEKGPPPACEKCGGNNVEQLLSGATIITSKKS
jgi:putative FmdB family regulatory protein